MPLIERKSQDMINWESWQKHLNKKFGVKEDEFLEKAEEPKEVETESQEEIVSLEFLEKPVE